MEKTRVAIIAEDGIVLAVEERDAGAVLAQNEVELGAGSTVQPGAWQYDTAAAMFVERPFKALLLDAEDVLAEVVELSGSSELTDRHVDLRPHGNDCDREPGRYRWDHENAALVPLSRAQLGAPAPRNPDAPDLNRALADFFKEYQAVAGKLPKSTRLWLEAYGRGDK